MPSEPSSNPTTATSNLRTAIVIEDDDATRFLMTRALRELHVVPIGLSSAEAAIAWIEMNGPPSLASVDVCLPRMTGFELCGWLRAHDATKDVPIVIVTARSDPADIGAARALSATLFPKPLRLTAYLAAVRELLAGATPRRPIRAGGPSKDVHAL